MDKIKLPAEFLNSILVNMAQKQPPNHPTIVRNKRRIRNETKQFL